MRAFVYYFVIYFALVQIVSIMEWNEMGTCQDQALCVGCVDLYQEST